MDKLRDMRPIPVERRILRGMAVVAAGALALALPAARANYRQGARAEAAALRGFSAARSAAEEQWESKFVQLPTAERAEATLRRLTLEPHMAGTEASRRVAEYVRAEYIAAGLEAEIVSYNVVLAYPGETLLQRTAPSGMRLARPEEPVAGDPSTSDPRSVPAFSAYSPAGEVTGEIVYVNYGLPEDFQRLAEMGVDVRGKIALIRYGQCFRGVKVHLAETNGAAAVLLYSDPADDGYRQGDPYPQGPWRPESGIERGSVQYTFLYPGNPIAPLRGMTRAEIEQRLETRTGLNLPRIPALPISWRDAVELMKYMSGPKVPREWQGGMPTPYFVGPGPSEAHLKVGMSLETRTIYDVIAQLPGETNDWVLTGNHHDAWVFGAADPGSGTTVLLEVARSLGALKREGWTPRRTILFCSWDAEEFGLVGSTAWVEDHMSELARSAVAYLNMDVAVVGERFGGAATPSLRELVRDAARETPDPRTGRTVYDRWRERVQQTGGMPHGSAHERGGAERPLAMSALGSGSDYSAFYQHAGIASIDISSAGDYGVYHSIYDDFDWMKRQGDPEFAYHVMMARIAGRIVMRLADADVPAFDYGEYAAEAQRLLGDLRASARAAGVRDARVLDLRGAASAAADFQAAAREASDAVHSLLTSSPDRQRAESVAHLLAGAESALLTPGGLAGRPWYRHTFSAPGINTGYAAVVFPGVREAIERRDWATARLEAESVREALERAAERLRSAARAASGQNVTSQP
ncbi:MAG TPA: M28 family metallopeptidase [Candidatus Acidoferrales bacterium]|nr:M28 family metallopeptidase [Candidatus Acidoferrales bacterium]